MSIVDRMVDRQTSFRRPYTGGLSAKMDEHPTHRIRDCGLATQQEYILSLTVEASYWANTAQVSDARRVARKSLVRHLYGDVLAHLHHLQLAASNGDHADVMRICGHLVNTIEGNE